MKERIKDARPMMDLMAKKVFSNPEITVQFIRDILELPVHHVKILDGSQIHNHQILNQADRIVSRKYWTWEERKMYDERTRYIQAHLGHLASIEKEKKDARMEGLAEGIEKGKVEGIEEGIEKGKAHGIEHGKKMMIISLIKDGLFSKEEDAKRLSVSVIELDECLFADE